MGISELLTFGQVAISAFSGLIWVFMMALFLWLTNKIFSVRNNSYWVSVLVSFVLQAFSGLWLLLAVIVSEPWVWLLVLPLLFVTWFVFPWLLVKLAFRTPWGKTFLVWLVWAAFSTVTMVVVSVIMYVIMLIFGIGMLALAMGAMA